MYLQKCDNHTTCHQGDNIYQLLPQICHTMFISNSKFKEYWRNHTEHGKWNSFILPRGPKTTEKAVTYFNLDLVYNPGCINNIISYTE